MITPNLSASSRFWQSIWIFLANFVQIALYYLIFIVWTWVLLSYLWTNIFSLAWKFVNMNPWVWVDSNSYINMWYFWIIYSIISFSILFLKIPFYISLIKSISDTIKWEFVDINANFIYWFKCIFKIFSTYWYIFRYVALIPCLILIFGLLAIFFNTMVWFLIIWLSFVIFVFFWIVRWLRSFLSLMYAISKDDYSEDNFTKSITITRGKLWWIFWNILLFAILFWIIWIFVDIWLNLIYKAPFSIDNIIYDMIQNKDNLLLLQDKLKDLMLNFSQNNWNEYLSLLRKTLDSIYKTIVYIIGIIYYFLLMKKLESEIKTEWEIYFNHNQ